MVNFSALDFPNMNPALNGTFAQPENVQIVNMLDQPVAGNMNVLEHQAMSDSLLEGIPGAMFDWGAFSPLLAVFHGCLLAPSVRVLTAEWVASCTHTLMQANGKISSRASRSR